MKSLKLINGKALIIVAHPDDETIWMGGTILKNPQIDWTIFSLCRKDDNDRAPKFLKVCEFYKAYPIISDLEDEGVMNVSESLQEIRKRLIQLLPNKDFNYIFTHGKNGEYGHFRHIGVQRSVKDLISKNLISCHNLFLFSYEKLIKKSFATPCQDADFYVSLKMAEFEIKRKIISDMYGFSLESFEYKSCAKMEIFTSSS